MSPFPRGGQHTEATKLRIRAAVRAAWADGRIAPSPDGRKRSLAGVAAYNALRDRCPLCGRWIARRAMARHQAGPLCRGLS